MKSDFSVAGIGSDCRIPRGKGFASDGFAGLVPQQRPAMHRLSIAASATLIVSLSLPACSSDEDSTNGSGSGGSSSVGSGGATGGAAGNGGASGAGGGAASGGSGGLAGTGGSAGSGASGGSAGTGGAAGSGGSGGSDWYESGYVSVMQSVVMAGGNEYASYSFAAGVSRGPISDTGGSGCSFEEDGPCRVTDCITQSADAGTPAYETVSAGVVQLLGANQPLSLSPDASGTYTAITGQEKLWSGGATLTISAGGNIVPAFEETLFGAAPVTLTSPAMPAPGTQTTLSTSSPLSLTWSGGVGGTVTVMLTRTITGATTRSVLVSCTYPATDGAGTVPASAMAALPPGPDGTFVVQGGDMKTIEPSGWSISLQEYVPAVTAEGTVASAMVTYQ